jgi:hypothetical protein
MASASLEEDKKKKGKKGGMSSDEVGLLGSTVQGGGTGTMIGAGVGSLFGPIGTVAGGAIGGAVDANQSPKKTNQKINCHFPPFRRLYSIGLRHFGNEQ